LEFIFEPFRDGSNGLDLKVGCVRVNGVDV